MGTATAVYQNAIVSYVDLLAFRGMIKDSATGKLDVESVRSTLVRLTSRTQEGKRVGIDPSKKIFYFHTFSDLTVRSTLVDNPHKITDYLNWELMVLADVQRSFAERGIFLRGGISTGKIYIDDNYVFGPAFVRSYELESRAAIFPRIVVDPALVAASRDFNQTDHLWEDHLSRGDDGSYFIDYLGSTLQTHYSFPDDGADPSFPWVCLDRHREAVLTGLSSAPAVANEGIKQKYVWLGLYHNSTIHRLRKMKEWPSELVGAFDRAEIPTLFLEFQLAADPSG